MGLLHSKRGGSATGRARIIDAKGLTVPVGDHVATHDVRLRTKISVRVTPDDGGPEFESQTSIGSATLGLAATLAGKKSDADQEHIDECHETYVTYDPEHPEQCEIDLDRLEREFGRTSKGQRRTVIPLRTDPAERLARSKALADGTFDPGEESEPAANTRTWTPSEDERPAAAPDIAAQLKVLVEMHASGALSDAEFAEAKSRALEGQ